MEVCWVAASETEKKQKSIKQNTASMNTKLNIVRILALAAVTAMLGVGLTVRAEDDTKPMKPMKGAEHLQHLNSPEKTKELKTGDTVAMVCSMCKNVAVTRVEKQRGREFLTPGTKHECQMCGGTIETVGQRMDKKDVITHTCSKCGGESAFCCATKPGEGATKGMEKK